MESRNYTKVFNGYFERKILTFQKSVIDNNKFSEPFITISRETGAENPGFFKNLIDFLNEFDIKKKNEWKLFDKNILEQVIKEHDLSSEMARYMPEKKISEMQGVIEQLFGLHPSEHILLKKLSSTILHLAVLGNVIIIGRGANIITQHLKKGIHLRLINSVINKENNIKDLLDISKPKAVKFINEEDKQRKQYLKKFFSCDISDESLYSLVINLKHISSGEAIKVIGSIIINSRR